MFTAKTDVISDGLKKFSLQVDGTPLSYAQVIDGWTEDNHFRCLFTALLADSSFSAFRWETPPLTNETATNPFEFVLLDTPSFCSRKSDTKSFRQHFTTDDRDHGVVAIQNLGGDARLIIPSPRAGVEAYGHVSAFVRNAPAEQVNALWRVVGENMRGIISDIPVWLSTAGGGVAWLHVRIDSRPKYYGYAAYRRADFAT